MLDTLLLGPSLHCNTSQRFNTLHPTTLHYTYRHFTSSHLHFTTLSFVLTHLHFLSFYFTSHHYTQYSSHLQTYFQNNEPLHCPKKTYHHFTSLHFLLFFTYSINPSLHFTLLFISTKHFPSLHFPSLHFLLFIAFTSPHWFTFRIYRVILKSLRDFRTRLRNNQDRHGRMEHINR